MGETRDMEKVTPVGLVSAVCLAVNKSIRPVPLLYAPPPSYSSAPLCCSAPRSRPLVNLPLSATLLLCHILLTIKLHRFMKSRGLVSRFKGLLDESIRGISDRCLASKAESRCMTSQNPRMGTEDPPCHTEYLWPEPCTGDPTCCLEGLKG
jgi:hypothetical protein